MSSAFSESEMASDDVLGMRASSGRRGKRCRHCKAAAVDPPLLTIDPRPRLHDWFLCEACWLLLEIGFSDARPYDDLYQYLSPLDGRLSDAEVYHQILRGRVLLERRGGLVRRNPPTLPQNYDDRSR
jgi:hypothetical protein